ncbi:hypothetical protein Salat_1434200 [Sesamum alatum]|uniref:Uncharacterized protein n=1 Tax=Sesamum alatum TaxID=300844 RepID=A0AAE1YAE7_9LAMI|nr:hypothetical protein Salat_1434200 [Sesamum alatum]
MEKLDDEAVWADVELGNGDLMVIIQLLHADHIPPTFHAFLANPRHIFCSVGVQEDVKKLYDYHPLHAGNTTNFNELTRLMNREDASECRHMELKKMALVHGKEMMKLKRVTLSK